MRSRQRPDPVHASSSLPRRLFAEALGTCLLVAAVVGSGIMAQRLSPQQTGVELLENALATAGALFVLIAALGPVSGAHFNPVVTAVDAWFGGTPRRDVVPYLIAQVVGACLGAMLANVMFGLNAVNLSHHTRSGAGILLSEVVATFGLLLVIMGLARGGRSAWVAGAVAAYIGAAYWFTASTSFANPAATVGRTLSNTFAGIAPASVPGFVVAEIVGGIVAVAAIVVLWPTPSPDDQPLAIDLYPESR
jgi:glycerol uptake facilitator-like aquaporin